MLQICPSGFLAAADLFLLKFSRAMSCFIMWYLFNNILLWLFVYLEFIAVGKRKDTAAETTNSNVVEIGMLNDILCSVSEFV